MKRHMAFLIEIEGWTFRASGKDLDRIRARNIEFCFVARA